MTSRAGTAGGIMFGRKMVMAIDELSRSGVKVESQKLGHATSMTGHNGVNVGKPAACR